MKIIIKKVLNEETNNIIMESKFNELITKLLKNTGVKVNIIYATSYYNGYGKRIHIARVLLLHNGEKLGSDVGYDFHLIANSGNRLTYEDHYPRIEKLNLFKPFPSDDVVKFFIEKTKQYLEKGIDEGWVDPK